MTNFTRRQFIQTGLAGTIVTCAGLSSLIDPDTKEYMIDEVELGKTGLRLSRLAFGMGSRGGNHESNQTRMGMNKFIEMMQYGYDRGVRFFDTADTYGSHANVKEALKLIPRESVKIQSKIWLMNSDGIVQKPIPETLDRFRKEMNTDYIDILLLHCLTNRNWPHQHARIMDALLEAKEKGIVKKVGISAHNFQAMEIAADHEWVDIMLARINHNGDHMDNTPALVMALLERAKNNGKGIIGMKIFGDGRLVDEASREKSLNYVIRSGNIHALTIGMESIEQVKDNVDRIMRIVNDPDS